MDSNDTMLKSVMNRNLVFVLAAIAVIALVGFAVMRSSGKPQPGVEAAAPSRPAPEAGAATPFIEQAEAKGLHDANAATVLDVRDVDAYTAAHIPGALQIPLSRVEGEIPYFPKDKPVIAYCTCPHDEAAIEAVQILQHGGVRDARVLHGGLQEWTRLGYPTASGLKN
jgi:rhodanese-related sulfurtransferase